MDKGLITKRIREIAESASENSPIELVHIEIAGTNRDLVVRIFIDKDGGVSLDDCSSFSHKVEAVLDAEDTIPTRYVLEVSSPGIERELYSLDDFVKFTGELAKLKTKLDIEGQRTFVGEIAGVESDKIRLVDRTRGVVEIEYGDIEKANLKIDLAKEFKSR
jgi:ribosome maturation factor RimP